VIFPFIVSAPRLFAGEIALGSLIQISQAFGQVQDSLSWFVNAYGSLANWKASVDRLVTFHDALERIESEQEVAALLERGVRTVEHPEPTLHAERLTLALPDGREIVSDAELTVECGERVLVTGPTGAGKSTLFRAAAGIWPFGEGQIALPEGARTLFLPQKPYLPVGTLRAAVSYPAPSDAFSDDAIGAALRLVRLGALSERLDEARNWSMTLSGGELQRLAIARALLHRPEWLFLDEATSALDPTTERHVYDLLREHLADATIVSIAHRPAADDFQDAIIELVPGPSGTMLRTRRAAELQPVLVAS
jgi:putative ATP-binding cassette transporter